MQRYASAVVNNHIYGITTTIIAMQSCIFTRMRAFRRKGREHTGKIIKFRILRQTRFIQLKFSLNMKMNSNAKRTRYSRQTKTLVQDLMNSVNLPYKQRNVILNHLEHGTTINLNKITAAYHPSTLVTVSYASKRAKKRPKTAIIELGSYDVDQFIPIRETMDREKEIEKLQNIFSGIEEFIEDDTDSQVPRTPIPDQFSKNQRIKELMQAIQERIDFLKRMEELGCKRKYEFDITLEISEKLHLLENLSKQ